MYNVLHCVSIQTQVCRFFSPIFVSVNGKSNFPIVSFLVAVSEIEKPTKTLLLDGTFFPLFN